MLVQEAIQRYQDRLTHANTTERNTLMDHVEPALTTHADETLFSPAPDETETAAAHLKQLTLTFTRRLEVANASLTCEQVADLLGVSRRTVLSWLRAGDVVGIRDGRGWMLPRWQFQTNRKRGLLPGIGDVADAFAGGVVALSIWMGAPSVELDGRTPRDVLASGHVERVRRLASALTAAGW